MYGQQPDAEKLILMFGEEYRKLIEDSVLWLEEREPTWNLPVSLDRAVFIEDLISQIASY